MWGLTGSIMHERKKNWKRLESVIAEKMSVCTQVAYACGSENIMRCKIEGRVDASGLTQTKYCNRAPDVQRWQIQEEGRPWKLVSSAAAAKSSSGVILDPRRCKHVWWSQSSESPAKRHCSAYLFIYLSRFQGFLFLRKEKKRFLFSGATLMRPSCRFHGDSHKTVKFPVFQNKTNKKSLVGWRVVVGVGCSSTVRSRFSKSASFLSEGETFIVFFSVKSAALQALDFFSFSFYHNTHFDCVEECQRDDYWICKNTHELLNSLFLLFPKGPKRTNSVQMMNSQ